MKRLFLVAGEASGDLLGADLIHAVKKKHPEYQYEGVGGAAMEQAGMTCLLDANELAVVGFVEVLKKIRVIRRAMRVIVAALKKNPPDLLILIDYPGFNLRLAVKAKALGIRVLYYVSPQIWAWRYHRIKTIKKNVDRMVVLFRFEEKIYQDEHVPVTLVGHPLVARLNTEFNTSQSYEAFQLDPSRPVVALLPGSRLNEINRLLPDLIGATRCIRRDMPEVQCVLVLAPNLDPHCVDAFDLEGIKVIQHETYKILHLCTAAVVASGTATLEVAVLQVPQVIVYRLHFLTYYMAKCLARVPYFGLCNIVAQKRVACELLQQQVTPKAISQEILKLIRNAEYRVAILKHMACLRKQLCNDYIPDKLSRVIDELVHRSPSLKVSKKDVTKQ